MEEAEFEREFNGSPVRRAGFWGCSAMWRLPWAIAGCAASRPGWKHWAEAADEGCGARRGGR